MVGNFFNFLQLLLDSVRNFKAVYINSGFFFSGHENRNGTGIVHTLPKLSFQQKQANF